MGELYLALMHYPIYNKVGDVVTTSITPLDLHDLARSCVTFGVRRCYIVNPLAMQRQVARRIASYWMSGEGGRYNQTRQDAFNIVRIVPALEDVKRDITADTQAPRLVATTARQRPEAVSFHTLAGQLHEGDDSYLLLFGTGWGMTQELLAECDYTLEPIRGTGPYNHLSVRAAVSIILDRLQSRYEAGSAAVPQQHEQENLSQ